MRRKTRTADETISSPRGQHLKQTRALTIAQDVSFYKHIHHAMPEPTTNNTLKNKHITTPKHQNKTIGWTRHARANTDTHNYFAQTRVGGTSRKALQYAFVLSGQYQTQDVVVCVKLRAVLISVKYVCIVPWPANTYVKVVCLNIVRCVCQAAFRTTIF